MFDPTDFLSLAKTLIKNNPDECQIRTSMGRAYYATFLYLREWLKTNVGCAFTGTHDDHKIVHDSLHDLDGRTFSDKLSTLRRHRGQADYDLTTFTLGKATNAINLANYLIKKHP